ncbi:hypothetical protein [Rhizobium sp. GCM10022189]|uniref:hypothetical protein n=1 Tax=Rhizobium sp. GCM10022189 TaxID=3252654 RepID=UPI00361B4F36
MSKESLGTFSVLNRKSGNWEDGVLYHGFDERNKTDIEELWIPMLREMKTAQAGLQDIAPRLRVSDAHWLWPEKMDETVKDALISDTFVFECANMTQAAMIIRKGHVKYLSLSSEHRGSPLVYVDILATAPWNRANHPEYIYKGCGELMLKTAISVSIDNGYKGRIALRALPGAESYYRGVGMIEFEEGIVEDKLKYFEVPESLVQSIFRRSPAEQGADR